MKKGKLELYQKKLHQQQVIAEKGQRGGSRPPADLTEVRGPRASSPPLIWREVEPYPVERMEALYAHVKEMSLTAQGELQEYRYEQGEYTREWERESVKQDGECTKPG